MTRLWAGDRDSWEAVLQAQAEVSKLLASDGAKAFMSSKEMNAHLPKLWRHEGNVAVIEINGPLVVGEAGWMRLFGVVGYDDLCAAAAEAAMDPETASMLYHINSPGGDVNGVIDAGALLSQISNMKPSAVHTSDLCASAGYWLATSIKGEMSAGPTAIVGSIGVLQVHMERSQMLEKDGIKATVIRSGAFKAEVNSYEALTPEAKARVESQLADVHAIFRAHVGRGRPNLAAEDLADVTQGQTFLGKRAKAAGLVDNIGSFAQALKLLDKRKHSSNTSSNSKGKAMKIVLNDEQIAAISAGATLDTLGFSAEQIAAHQAAETAEKLAAENDAAAQAATQAADEAAAAAIKAAADAAPAQAPPAVSNDVVALLQSQLATERAAVLAANVELVNLKASTQSMTASHDGLLAIARGAVAKMAVALGGSSAASEGLDAAAAIAEHARLAADFSAKFKPGQQSASVKAQEVKKDTAPAGFLSALANQRKSA